MLVIVGSILAVLLIILFIAAFQKATNAVCVSKKRLDGKTVIVTGGTAGMGLETAKDFALRGARVIIACPYKDEGINAKKLIIEETENNNVVFKLLDLASLESTRRFAADILNSEDRLDILVNNAGILGAPQEKTKDGLNFVMQVNYFGTFILSLLLLPILKKTGIPGEPSRIVNITSVSHVVGNIRITDIDSLNYSEHMFQSLAYTRSKICLLLFTHELAKKLQDWNVVVNCVDPGIVGTNIYHKWHTYAGVIVTWLFFLLFKTPWQGAQTAIHVSVDEKAGKVSGACFKNCKISKPIKKATDDELAKKLWMKSIEIVKFSEFVEK